MSYVGNFLANLCYPKYSPNSLEVNFSLILIKDSINNLSGYDGNDE